MTGGNPPTPGLRRAQAEGAGLRRTREPRGLPRGVEEARRRRQPSTRAFREVPSTPPGGGSRDDPSKGKPAQPARPADAEGYGRGF